MHTNNGAHGQSGFTGQQATNNGVQGQPSFLAQQAVNVNGLNPATPNQNNFEFHRTMPISGGEMPTQQARPHGQPRFASQQLVYPNGNGNGMNRTMSIRNRQGTPMHFVPGNAQLVQNGPQAQPGSVGQQIFNGSDLAMALAADPNAMAGFSQLCDAFLQQRVQSQDTQNHQNHQIRQNLQNQQISQYDQNHQVQQYRRNHPNSQNHRTYHHGGEFHTATSPNTSVVSSGDDTRIFDLTQNSTNYNNLPATPASSAASYPNQPVAGTPPDAGVAEPVQPPMDTESPEEFQQRVNGLVGEKGHKFGGYINSDAERVRFEKAIWTAKWKGGKLEDKSGDYPDDEAERSKISQRIFDAFINTEGDQDPATDAAQNGDCLAVRAIRKLSSLEIELLSRKLMDDMLKVQRGEPVLPPHLKVVQEENFMAKVKEVVEALSFNKALCRSATTTAEFIARIAADPVGERGQKRSNRNNNRGKNKVLKEEAEKKGKSRGKGKGKRVAEAEPEAEPSQEAPAEVSDAGRPTKRARTTKKAAQAAQPNIQRQTPDQPQAQQNQPATADFTNAQAFNHPVNAAQGSFNSNQGAFGPATPQTNNFSHGSVQHINQNPSPSHDVFGQNNQANVDQNGGGFAFDFPPTNHAGNNLSSNQVDGAQNPSPDAAAIQIQGFGLPQSQTDAFNGWEESDGNNAMDGFDVDFSLGTAPQNDPVMNQQAVNPHQDFPQQAFQQQPAQQQTAPQSRLLGQNQQTQDQQPAEEEQPAQEQEPIQQFQSFDEEMMQQQLTWGESGMEGTDGVDLYGDLDYEQLVASLQPLVQYNAEN